MSALGLLDQESKSETQGQLSSRGGAIRARLGLLLSGLAGLGTDPDPALFVSDLQDANKKYFIFPKFFLLITF